MRSPTRYFERLYGDPANPQGPDRAPPEFMVQMVAQMRADIEGMQFNHETPVVLSLRATWEGGLWVRRRREGDPWEGVVAVIDVWNPDGRYVGTLPPDDPPMPETPSAPMAWPPGSSWTNWTCRGLWGGWGWG